MTFTGEPGLDMGGLTKEWFLLLIKQIFQENYGMYYIFGLKRIHFKGKLFLSKLFCLSAEKGSTLKRKNLGKFYLFRVGPLLEKPCCAGK